MLVLTSLTRVMRQYSSHVGLCIVSRNSNLGGMLRYHLVFKEEHIPNAFVDIGHSK